MVIFDPAADSALLTNRAGCWEYIRRFAAAWRTPLLEDDGDEAWAIEAAQQELNVPLPAALWEAYRLLGRRDDLTRNQHELLRLADLEVWSPETKPDWEWDEDAEAVLVFRDESQGCTSWGVKVADLHLDDPPVVFEYGGWVPYLERFSLAIVDTVLAETTCGHGTSDFHSWSPVLVNQITEQCPQLALPPYPVGYNATDPRITWYGRPDLLFKVMEHYGVDAFGRTPEALANALDLLPGWHAASSS